MFFHHHSRYRKALSITLLLAVLHYLALFNLTLAASYFVDATGGSDSNNGTASSTAWRTIAKVNASSSIFQSGDTVNFKRGEIWREQLTVSVSGTVANPIVYQDYGSGTKPTIYGSENLNGTWAVYSGNIYRASSSALAGVTGNVTVGTSTAAVTNLAPSDGNFASLSLNQWDWTANELFVNIGANPTGGTIEVSSRTYAIAISPNVSNVAFNNFILRSPASNAWHILTGGSASGITVNNLEAYNSENDGFQQNGSTSVAYTNVTSTDNGDDGISFHDTSSGSVEGAYLANNPGGAMDHGTTAQTDANNVTCVGNGHCLGFSTYANDGITRTSSLTNSTISSSSSGLILSQDTAGEVILNVSSTNFINSVLLLQGGNASRINLNNVTFNSGASRSPISLSGGAVWNINFTSTTISSGLYGIYLNGSGTSTVDLTGLTMNPSSVDIGVRLEAGTTASTTVKNGTVVGTSYGILNAANNFTARDIIFNGGSATGLYLGGNGSNAINVTTTGTGVGITIAGANATVATATIQNTAGTGIEITNTASNVTLNNIYVSGLAGVGISVNSSTVTISNYQASGTTSNKALQATNGSVVNANKLKIHHSGTTGVQTASNAQLTLDNSLFYNNSGQYAIDNRASTTVRNSVFHGNGTGIITVSPNYTTVYNSIFSQNDTAVNFSGGASDAASSSLAFNDFWANSANLSAGTSTNSYFVNPLYRSSSTFDFRLFTSSTIIDAGTSNFGATSTDYLGRSRYDTLGITNSGSGTITYYDVGAYENVIPSNPVITSASHSTSTTWYSTTTIDVGLGFTDDASTTYKYLFNQSSTASTSTVNASGTTDVDGAFTIASSSLSGDGTYYVHEIALDVDNVVSDGYTTRAFKIDTTAPSGFSLSTTTLFTYISIQVRINNATDTSSGLNSTPYYFREGITSSSAGFQSSNLWSKTGLTANTQYSFQAQVRDAASSTNVSALSSPFLRYTKAVATSPLGFATTSVAGTSVGLSVTAINNPTASSSGYYFYASSTDGNPNSDWIQTNTWTATGLTCDTSYTWKARVRNGDGVQSSDATAITQGTTACPSSGGVTNPAVTISGNYSGYSPPPAPIVSTTTSTSSPPVFLPSPSSSSGIQARIQEFLTQLAVLQTKLNALLGGGGMSAPTGSVPQHTFTKPLYPGLKDDEVKILQEFLSSQGSEIYPEALVTGYFGPLTKRAVQRFQLKHGITTEDDSAFGYVGPKTRGKMNELMKNFSQ